MATTQHGCQQGDIIHLRRLPQSKMAATTQHGCTNPRWPPTRWLPPPIGAHRTPCCLPLATSMRSPAPNHPHWSPWEPSPPYWPPSCQAPPPCLAPPPPHEAPPIAPSIGPHRNPAAPHVPNPCQAPPTPHIAPPPNPPHWSPPDADGRWARNPRPLHAKLRPRQLLGQRIAEQNLNRNLLPYNRGAQQLWGTKTGGAGCGSELCPMGHPRETQGTQGT